MTQKPNPEPTAATPAVEIDVARTGGVAGVTRRWSAQAREAEATKWISLIDRCPWDEVAIADPVPDGFVWCIRAERSGTDAREAELPDDELVGAWRELVDAVRDWSRQRSGPQRAGR